MKTRGIFWGSFLISFGILFLLCNVSNYSVTIPFYEYWPLVIVIWGIILIVKQQIVKQILSGLNGVFISLIIFSLSCSLFVSFDHWGKNDKAIDYVSKTESLNKDVKTATLKFSSALCNLALDNASDTNLIKYSYSSNDIYSLDRETDSTNEEIELKLRDSHVNLPRRNYVEVGLNSTPDWEMKYDVGLSNLKLDLREIKVKEANLNIGLTSAVIKVGNLSDSVKIIINAGLSNIIIEIPSSSACQVYNESGLTSEHFSGLDEVSDNIYESSNFKNVTKKIFITLKSGLSSVTIKKV